MEYDIIVVGGGPAGMISAITARKYYPDKKILLIKSIGKGVIPCGIPYMFTTLAKPEDNAAGNAPLEKNSIDLMVDEVTGIDKEAKKIITKASKTLSYERLVLATGSHPIIPPIEGIDKKGVYCVNKEMDYLKKLKDSINDAKNIVIIGGGFIGIEFADELSRLENAKITLIEMLPEVLANSFDSEFSKLAGQNLVEAGIELLTSAKVVKFSGAEKIDSILLSDGKEVPADLVILGIGADSNSELAEKAGLKIGESRGILVDEYLRTSCPGIFAIGDCAEKKDFFTRKKINVMLASTATAEARIAGANLFGLKVVRENKGTIAIYSTKVQDLVLASAGLTEKTASQEGFEIIIGNAECPDRHPAAMPGMSKMKVKLIFSKQSGILLGGQVAGNISAGEFVNIIGLALQKKASLTELETLQIATHPLLTAAPTMYPLINAAQDALKQYEVCK